MKTVLGLLALAACNGSKDEPPASGETGTPGEEFAILGDGAILHGAILSVWGTSQDDVFLVGADDGEGPLVLHWDGTAWARLATGTTGDLWWVFGVAGADTVWMSGEGGRVLTYTRSTGAFVEEIAADPVYKMFGVWGTSDTDRWAVGGDVNNGADGIVVHDDGTGWTTSWLVPPIGLTKRQAFKIWGPAADDVYVVGTRALVAHWDGAAWTDLPYMGYGANTYFTVHGTSGSDVYVVGGEGNAVVLHWDGTAWEDVSPPPADIVPVLNGVSASATWGTAVCGAYGSIYWREEPVWAADPRPRPTSRDFHACWVDDQGAVWAVGGDLTSLAEGVVVYGGDHVPPITY